MQNLKKVRLMAAVVQLYICILFSRTEHYSILVIEQGYAFALYVTFACTKRENARVENMCIISVARCFIK